MNKLSKMKNSFIETIYSNPVNWPKFIGLIQLLIAEAAYIYCIFNINDIGIKLMMLLFLCLFPLRYTIIESHHSVKAQ